MMLLLRSRPLSLLFLPHALSNGEPIQGPSQVMWLLPFGVTIIWAHASGPACATPYVFARRASCSLLPWAVLAGVGVGVGAAMPYSNLHLQSISQCLAHSGWQHVGWIKEWLKYIDFYKSCILQEKQNLQIRVQILRAPLAQKVYLKKAISLNNSNRNTSLLYVLLPHNTFLFWPVTDSQRYV